MEIYGTVDGYKAYHDARGNIYVADDAAIASALLRGSEYIDGNYRTLFPGEKTGARAQEREWPRISTIDSIVVDIYDEQIASDEIPTEVINAAYEASLREQATPGSLSPDVNPSERRQRVRVEGAVDVTYAEISASDTNAYRLSVTIIDGIIAPVLTGGQGTGAFASFGGKAYRI